MLRSDHAASLIRLQRFKEAKLLLRRQLPVARRVLGDCGEITLTMRALYAQSLYINAAATLDDLREAVTTLEETAPIGRRVFGSEHPVTSAIERRLRGARAVLRALWCPRIAVFEEFCELGGED